MHKKENDQIKIAKRDGNKNRSFLLVNPLQGKHLPADPDKVIGLMHRLAEKVNAFYQNERLLVIGFAETATAISAALTDRLAAGSLYIHTTREDIAGMDYLFFSEEHSHAAEQKIAKNFLDRHSKDFDRILFAEDEVTTGKTIENIMHILNRSYPDWPVKYGIASIVNGIPAEKQSEFRKKDVLCHSLSGVAPQNYEHYLAAFHYDPSLTTDCRNSSIKTAPPMALSGYFNIRKGDLFKNYAANCHALVKASAAMLPLKEFAGKDVLVLGTEEFMYPPLLLASHLKANCACKSVRFHATTRSPILPSGDTAYPIAKRYILNSFYQRERITYIYNLKKYDYVIILTDAPLETGGIASLIQALFLNGNDTVFYIKWR